MVVILVSKVLNRFPDKFLSFIERSACLLTKRKSPSILITELSIAPTTFEMYDKRLVISKFSASASFGENQA